MNSILRSLTLLLIFSGIAAFAQEPVLLNDFATSGAGTFQYDPEIEGITTSNQLFFIADDGTPEGTAMMYDILPGPNDSSPIILDYINDVLYFTAIEENSGRELWALSPLRIQAEVSASSSGVCSAEDSVTFTATVTDAGAAPTYQWYLNDQPVADQTSSTFAANGFSDGDEVKVLIVASEEVWALQDSVFSETITIDFSALVPKITVASNTLTATKGTTYQWYLEGEVLADATSQTITAQESGNYQVEITNASGCVARSEEVEVIVCTSDVPTIQVEGTTLTASEEGIYRWFLDGEELPDTTQSIEAEEAGNYQVEVTDASGCVARSEEVEVEATVTSLADEQLARGLRLYPNPATSSLMIDSQLNEAVQIFIYTTTGQLRHQSRINPTSEGTEVLLADFSPGLYLVQFASEQGWH
jgi:ELWxxDGT repeat protein